MINIGPDWSPIAIEPTWPVKIEDGLRNAYELIERGWAIHEITKQTRVPDSARSTWKTASFDLDTHFNIPRGYSDCGVALRHPAYEHRWCYIDTDGVHRDVWGGDNEDGKATANQILEEHFRDLGIKPWRIMLSKRGGCYYLFRVASPIGFFAQDFLRSMRHPELQIVHADLRSDYVSFTSLGRPLAGFPRPEEVEDVPMLPKSLEPPEKAFKSPREYGKPRMATVEIRAPRAYLLKVASEARDAIATNPKTYPEKVGELRRLFERLGDRVTPSTRNEVRRMIRSVTPK